MSEKMILIAGRNSKQGASLNAGKMKPEYIEVTSTVEMNEEDMNLRGIFGGFSAFLIKED